MPGAPRTLVDLNNEPLGTLDNPFIVEPHGANDITVSGSPVSPTNGLPVAPVTITWTQTIVTLAAGVSSSGGSPFVAANASRKALRWMVTGANPMTVIPGAGPAVAGNGLNYSPPSGTGQQGGADGFVGELSTQAFTAISTLGTTVTVWEGQ